MTDFLPASRLQLRRALYRLVGVQSDNDALVENGEALGEVGNYYVQHGIWLAQRYLIKIGYREWLKTAVPSFAAEAADGTRSADLPTDFLRLAGDQQNGALMDADGRPWGGEIDARQKRRAGPYAYWIENGKLYVGRSADPPTGAYIEYHYKHPTLATDSADTDPLDFPEDWTPLIPAEGAFFAAMEGWLPGGEEMRGKIMQNRVFWRAEAGPWFKKTGEPQKLRPPRVQGTHFFI
jgi:hypothetical protein